MDDTWAKFLRYDHFGEFLEFFGDRMANLGLIDFKLGLYIEVTVNVGHKIGQMPLLGKNINWA